MCLFEVQYQLLLFSPGSSDKATHFPEKKKKNIKEKKQQIIHVLGFIVTKQNDSKTKVVRLVFPWSKTKKENTFSHTQIFM